MSQEDAIRRQVQEQYLQNPQTSKVEAYQVGGYWQQQVINSEIEHQRRQEEERRRQQNQS